MVCCMKITGESSIDCCGLSGGPWRRFRGYLQRTHIYCARSGTPLESVSEGEKRMDKWYIACMSLTIKTASGYRFQ